MTAFLAAAALVACSPVLPDPILSEVTPGWGFNGEETEVQVTGAGFFPRVEVDGRDGEYDDGFELWLGTDPETALGEVQMLDYEHLQAVVPLGLETGLYDLRVVTPGGHEGTLVDGFEVRDSRADNLVASTENGQVQFQVYDYAAITIALVDRDGQPVNEDLLIEATVAAEDVETTLFQDATLTEQEVLPDGSGIQGRLGPDGVGVVALTSTSLAEELLVRFTVPEGEGDVTGTVQFLSFVAGDPVGLRIDLPSEAFTATAGEPFDVSLVAIDEDGNLVESAQVELAVQEGCAGGTFRESVSFVGQKKLTVTFSQATGDGCSLSSLQALGFVDGVPVDVSSAGFEVEAAPAVGLNIDVWPPVVIAGQDKVFADVQALDAYGNRVEDRTGSLQMLVTIDGRPPVEPAADDCEDLVQGQAYCRVRIDTAGDEVVLLATSSGPDSLSGASEPFVVTAGLPAELRVNVFAAPAVAGEAFDLDLIVLDALGNGVLLDPLGADVPLFNDLDEDVVCAWSESVEPRGTERYACVATRATAARVLEVELPSVGQSTISPPFEVINGPLARVAFDLGSVTRVTAGQELELGLEATDAWGNPYVEQDDPVVELADLAGPASPASVSLGADGNAHLAVILTTAMDEDWLIASQDGVVLGTSTVFAVDAAAASTLALEAPQTWASLDSALPILVRAEDRFGNAVRDYSEQVELRSEDGHFDSILIDSFSDGEAEVLLQALEAGLEDRVLASDGSLTGSLELDLVDLDCPTPPEAVLLVDGGDEAVLCLLPTLERTRIVTVSAEDSEPGTRPLAALHFDDGVGGWSRGTVATWPRSWSAAGGYRLDLLIVDDLGCADRDQAWAYVAPDDGSAAGPVTLETLDPAVSTLGDVLPDSTRLSVQAWTCTGDAAAGASVYVRADRGSLVEDGLSAIWTGEGLRLSLDDHGSGELDWTVAGSGYAGTAQLLAGLPGGQALGQVSVQVQDDLVLPRVLDVDPHGTTDLNFSSVEIAFTEAILASSVQPEAFSLFDPDGVAWTFLDEDLSLSSDGRRVLLQLGETVSGADGIWTLGLAGTRESGVRDLEGNVLDGSWTGVRSGFNLSLGAVPNSAPDLLECAADTAIFRPDGDDGAGAEADQVVLGLRATAAPTWWRVEATDSAAEAVWTAWVPASGSDSLDLSWDGRADDGAVLGNDEYTLSVQAADSRWNLSAPCAVQVDLDNRIPSP